MGPSIKKYLCILLLCVLTKSAAPFNLGSSSSVCQLDFKTFLHDLNSQCPFTDPFYSSPIQMDGESFEKAMTFSQKKEYTAVLFYASRCPFSTMFLSKFSTLSSMYPQITHVMVEQSSAMPSVFSRYGIHSVPALLIVNQTAQVRHHGSKDLASLISFYKRTTGLVPMLDIVEETPKSREEVQPRIGESLKEIFLMDPYLAISLWFVLYRFFLYILNEISSRLLALWVAYIPHLNLGIFGEWKQLLAHGLQMVDLKRIWTKLKICKTRNFHRGAINARVWASSISSVLGRDVCSKSISFKRFMKLLSLVLDQLELIGVRL